MKYVGVIPATYNASFKNQRLEDVERRYEELKAKGIESNLEEIEKDIAERDYRDMNREFAPLRQAEDAVLLDTSSMSIDEVVKTVECIVAEKQSV